MKRILLASAIAASLSLASFAFSQETPSSSPSQPTTSHVSHGDTRSSPYSASTIQAPSKTASKSKSNQKSKSSKKAKKTTPPQS